MTLKSKLPVNKIYSFLFPEDSAFQLGVARFLFYFIILFCINYTPYPVWGFVDKQLWRAAGFAFLIPVDWLTYENLVFLTSTLQVSIILSALGFLTRVSTFVSLICVFFLFSVDNSFGHFYHYETLPLFGFMILALSPCGDSFSIDQYIFKKEAPPSSILYGWQARLIQILWCWMFFSAGVAKLFTSGFSWITTDTLSYHLISNQITRIANLDNSFWSTWGMHLAKNTFLCHALALFVMCLELTFPIAIFKKRLRWFYLSSGFIFQISIFIFMGIKFSHYFALLPFWINWSSLKNKLTTKLSAS